MTVTSESTKPQQTEAPLPNADTVFYDAKDVKRLNAALDRRLKEARSRRTLKALVYEIASKVELLLELGDSFEQIAFVFSNELSVVLKAETLRRYLRNWRNEQKAQESAQLEPATVQPESASAPSAQQQLPLSTSIPAIAAVQPAQTQAAARQSVASQQQQRQQAGATASNASTAQTATRTRPPSDTSAVPGNATRSAVATV
jgi:hypothetical protein